MSKAIELATPNAHGYKCVVCGGSKDVKLFYVETTEVRDTTTWCSTCGKQAIEVLSRAFSPDDVPLWLRMMDRLGSGDKLGKAGADDQDEEEGVHEYQVNCPCANCQEIRMGVAVFDDDLEGM